MPVNAKLLATASTARPRDILFWNLLNIFSKKVLANVPRFVIRLGYWQLFRVFYSFNSSGLQVFDYYHTKLICYKNQKNYYLSRPSFEYLKRRALTLFFVPLACFLV